MTSPHQAKTLSSSSSSSSRSNKESRPAMSMSFISNWARAHLLPLRRSLSSFLRPSSFSLPSKPLLASSSARLRRNLHLFRIHYLVLQWVLLLLSLFPAHKPSMLFLMAASKFALLYELILKSIPATWHRLRRLLSRRFFLGVFAVVALAEICLTGAVLSLAEAVAVGAPVILVHAVFKDAEEEEDPDRDLEEGTAR